MHIDGVYGRFELGGVDAGSFMKKGFTSQEREFDLLIVARWPLICYEYDTDGSSGFGEFTHELASMTCLDYADIGS